MVDLRIARRAVHCQTVKDDAITWLCCPGQNLVVTDVGVKVWDRFVGTLGISFVLVKILAKAGELWAKPTAPIVRTTEEAEAVRST